MKHVRVAIYNVVSGTAAEVAEIAREGFLPLLNTKSGFGSYELVLLDDGGLLAISIWDTAQEALAATTLASAWVHENLPSRIELRDEYVGDFAVDA